MGSPLSPTCRYETERLAVRPWHDAITRSDDLATVVSDLLSEPVTRALPESWRGGYSFERARNWIAERDAESPTLLAIETSTKRPVGLIMLFESSEGASAEIRLGYIVAESHWGKGVASEMVSGLVAWVHALPVPVELVAGVETDNAASIRVLEKCGFELADTEGSTHTFVLRARGRSGSGDEVSGEL